MDDDRRELLQVLVFSASLRADSFNTRLAQLAATVIERLGASVDLASIGEFDAPSYDGDVEASDGPPAGAQAFRVRLEVANAFVIVSPEYNASMPGMLKNAIDWVSRARPQPFNQRHGLLMSASPSMVGGNCGLGAASPTNGSRAGSTTRSPRSWTSSRQRRITRASSEPGSSSSASNPTPPLTGSTAEAGSPRRRP